MRGLALVTLFLVAGCDSAIEPSPQHEANRARCIDAGHACGNASMPLQTCGSDTYPSFGPCEAPTESRAAGVCCDLNSCTRLAGVCVAQSSDCPSDHPIVLAAAGCDVAQTKCCASKIIDAGSARD